MLMLYSVVDDRSGVAYQKYHVVYGEDIPAALRFVFRAMAPKAIEGFPLLVQKNLRTRSCQHIW